MARIHRLSLWLGLAMSVALVSLPTHAADPPPSPEKTNRGGAQKPGKVQNASDLPPSAAKRLILKLQKNVRDGGLDPVIVKRPVGEAIRAAGRARGARDAGDTRNGTLLDKLAEQWATAGQAVLRAVRSESAAKKAATRLSEITTKVKRAEALLHEQQARLGRLKAELKRFEAKTKARKAAAAGAEKQRVEKSGTKGPGKLPKKGTP